MIEGLMEIIKHLKETKFLVRSKSNPKNWHTVDLYNLSCSDCPANSHGKMCWHIKEVQKFNFETNPPITKKLLDLYGYDVRLDKNGLVVRIKRRG